MQIDSSANRTGSDCASAVECAMTVRMPISRQVRITRSAISPRLAIRILWNTRLLRLEHRWHALPLVHALCQAKQRPALWVEIPERRLDDDVAGKLGVLRGTRLPSRLHVPVVDHDRDRLGRHIDVADRDPPAPRSRDAGVQ